MWPRRRQKSGQAEVKLVEWREPDLGRLVRLGEAYADNRFGPMLTFNPDPVLNHSLYQSGGYCDVCTTQRHCWRSKFPNATIRYSELNVSSRSRVSERLFELLFAVDHTVSRAQREVEIQSFRYDLDPGGAARALGLTPGQGLSLLTEERPEMSPAHLEFLGGASGASVGMLYRFTKVSVETRLGEPSSPVSLEFRSLINRTLAIRSARSSLDKTHFAGRVLYGVEIMLTFGGGGASELLSKVELLGIYLRVQLDPDEFGGLVFPAVSLLVVGRERMDFRDVTVLRLEEEIQGIAAGILGERCGRGNPIMVDLFDLRRFKHERLTEMVNKKMGARDESMPARLEELVSPAKMHVELTRFGSILARHHTPEFAEGYARAVASFRSSLARALSPRGAGGVVGAVTRTLHLFLCSRYSLDRVLRMDLTPGGEAIKLWECGLRVKGAEPFSESVRHTHGKSVLFVYPELIEDVETWNRNRRHFVKLLEEGNSSDVTCYIHPVKDDPNIRIESFEKGCCRTDDLLEDYRSNCSPRGT